MDSIVMACVEAKCSAFDLYFEVSEKERPAVDEMIQKIHALGERSANATDFENSFQKELMGEYTALFSKLTPKSFPEASPDQIRSDFKQNAVDEMKDMASVYAREGMRTAKRDVMIAAGVFQPYTRITNAIDDVKIAGNLAGKLFGRKKSKKKDPENEDR